MINAVIARRPALIASHNDIRAAQYIRMSTDHQRYSAENQAAAIATFAQQKTLEIVRTYSDEGRSGVNIRGRSGLTKLIDDVRSGCADFSYILVYDVSRWGRFQDADESAYYEFICKEAGISVIYCAEQFENDGSLSSTIMKNLKRAMAGEYSRELSVKVFIGQCRMVRMGFWPGGGAGYGLRRQLLDERGSVRTQMEAGQCKYLQTDRTVLVLGPTLEVSTVDRVFRSFVFEKKLPGEIAAELNADNLRNLRGNPWSAKNIRELVSNERNIGNLVYNRSSFKLKRKLVSNPSEMWIRNEGAIPALIAPDVFSKAQEIISERRRKRTDQEALDRLAALAREKGGLTRAIIAASENTPSAELYRRRFGSLMNAYELAGYLPGHQRRVATETKKRFRSMLNTTANEIVEKIAALGGEAIVCGNGVLNINNELSLTLRIASAVMEGNGRQTRWRVHTKQQKISSLTLLLRMDRSNQRLQSLFLLPIETLEMPKTRALYLANSVFDGACRYDSLETFCRHCVGYGEDAHDSEKLQDQNGANRIH